MNRIEVNTVTGEITVVELTAAEQTQAAIQYAAWQVEENIRLAKVAEEEARQVQFQEWLNAQGAQA
jgi:hypothetical protein